MIIWTQKKRTELQQTKESWFYFRFSEFSPESEMAWQQAFSIETNVLLARLQH
ncbi:hypothetical protein ABID29_000344 [Streptococcus rupicaprae]|uniref:Uncharacterized protein n=1 Tax=Streptococcus rupicaprae TaxID=759619 RepID=A0ABV2FF89_9STRE